MYDKEGLGYITTDTLRGLISELLAPLTDEELEGILEELDEDGSGEIEFGEFCQLCATFLVEDPDMETMKRELKDAFR